jgi:ABC-type multidrug transport system fused ATPase/permease subunit
MDFLLKYFKDYKKESILAPAFKMTEAVFELLVPLVVAAVIDRGIANGDTAYIVKMCGLLILMSVAGLVFSVTAQYFAAKAAIYISAKMRQDLFCHIIDMSPGSHGKVGTSALTTRITSDINQVQSGINMFLRLFLRSPFIVMGALIMAFFVDASASLIFVLVIAVLGVVVFFVMKTTLPIFSRIQKQMEKIFREVGENLEGARVIRAFGNQQQQLEEFEGQTTELYNMQMQAGGISALLNPVTYVVVNLGIIAVLWFGAAQVEMGLLATGEVVALINYMSQILVELVKLANLIVLLMRAVPSVGRIRQVMEMPADERRYTEKEAQKQSEMAVELQDVSFAYPDGADTVLSHISLQVPKGSTVGIIGGTASGKSTLLQLLYHGYDVTEGQIRLEGRDIASYSQEELAKRIGVVPQKALLFTGTIEENLRMGRADITEDMLATAVTAAQAQNVIASKENGMQEPVLQDARNFSGGQRQRLTIARALAGQPDILMLDDSASALDMATDAALRKAIRQLSWHPTTFIVSQRASAVMAADQILVLEHGNCVGLGTHEQLLAENEIYQEIYYSQFPREVQG